MGDVGWRLGVYVIYGGVGVDWGFSILYRIYFC